MIGSVATDFDQIVRAIGAFYHFAGKGVLEAGPAAAGWSSTCALRGVCSPWTTTRPPSSG